MLQTEIVEKVSTHILYSVSFFLNCAVCEIMWTKSGRAGQATDGNIIWCV